MKEIKTRKLHLNKIIDVEPIATDNDYKENTYKDNNQEVSLPVLIILVLNKSI